MADADLLYEWRVRREGHGWYGSEPTKYEAHRAWLEARLENPLVYVLIWNDGEGMIRIDSNGELAFEGPLEMVRELQSWWRGKLKATVDVGDDSGLVLAAAGFRPSAVDFYSWRPPHV